MSLCVCVNLGRRQLVRRGRNGSKGTCVFNSGTAKLPSAELVPICTPPGKYGHLCSQGVCCQSSVSKITIRCSYNSQFSIYEWGWTYFQMTISHLYLLSYISWSYPGFIFLLGHCFLWFFF